MLVLGIDEAGRGAILGPLVLCGFAVDEERIGHLRQMRVRDSKLLTPCRRSFLYQKLKKAGKAEIFVLTAAQIDRMRTESNLNRIEITHMQKLINKVRPDKIQLDSVEANTHSFCRKVIAGLEKKDYYRHNENFICENFADRKYPAVAAASIIAKVVRDAEVSRLHRRYGYFGSGYTSDPRTISFIKKWLSEHGSLPEFARSSWVTAKVLKKDHEQKRLGDFA